MTDWNQGALGVFASIASICSLAVAVIGYLRLESKLRRHRESSTRLQLVGVLSDLDMIGERLVAAVTSADFSQHSKEWRQLAPRATFLHDGIPSKLRSEKLRKALRIIPSMIDTSLEEIGTSTAVAMNKRELDRSVRLALYEARHLRSRLESADPR